MIIGIDIGTQSLKAVVTNLRLQPLASASRSYQPDFPQAGWAEQDPKLWEHALRPAILEALERAGEPREAVQALAIAGQLDGCIGCDANGKALSNCLIWLDRRASAEIAHVPANLIREYSGVIADPSHMAAKIRWLRRQHPAGRRMKKFQQPVSYLVSRLTGVVVMDHALASTTMLYDLKRHQFHGTLLDAFEIDTTELPTLAAADTIAGRLNEDGATLTGLTKGVPVAVGTGDDFANLLGAGVVDEGPLTCSLGTAEVVGALHSHAVVDSGGLVETHAFLDGRYFIENPGWLSGGALTWLIELLRLKSVHELDSLAASAAIGAGAVSFIPALSGAMAPEWISSARGCFYGLSAAHNNSHLARAVLEGCAFALRDVSGRLAELGVKQDDLLLMGGGAQSRIWAQIRADVLQLPVRVSPTHETSALGAAALAAVATGQSPNIAEAVAGWQTKEITIHPNPQTADRYDQAYQRYRDLFACLRPLNLATTK